MSIITSRTSFTTFDDITALTSGATGRAARPMKSVPASTLSRRPGVSTEYLRRAEWIKSAIFTPEGQATSHLLQFMQYLRFSSKKYLFLSLSLSPSGPPCFGPG